LTALVKAVLLLLAACGHVILWLGLANRLHATAVPRLAMKAITGIFYSLMLAIPALLFFCYPKSDAPYDRGAIVIGGYALLTIAVAVLRGPVWIVDRLRHRPPAIVMNHHVASVDLAATLGFLPVAGLRAKVLSRVPGNQVFHLDVDTEEVELSRLPSALAGLSILHLSDFHLSGRITREYFDEMVRIANRLQPDLIAITGDICDAPQYINWAEDILGQLVAPMGKFFVLGNHDIRVRDVGLLRSAMAAAGCVDLGAGPQTIELHGQSVLLAGNERPWFPLADSTAAAARETQHFKILLAHSPDQFHWARQLGFDLMLAGHTHGGQICLPVIGPVVCPSRHGIRYAGGTFFQTPTLMHVSRGVSNLFPLRLLCPPEMTKLVLRRAASDGP
jgi:uncharacterized protein